MSRFLLPATTLAAMFWSSTALADLVITIPDVPVFTLSDPIISDENVFINAGSGTTLIIDTRIEGRNVTITAGQVDLRSGDFGDSISIRVNSDGIISLPDTSTGPLIPISTGGDITLVGADAPDNPIVIDGAAATGAISVTSGGTVAGRDVIITATRLDTSGEPVTLSTAVTATTNITLTSASGRPLATANVAGDTTVTGIRISDTETPIAVLATSTGTVLLPLEASTFEPLEVDLGGGTLAADRLNADAFTGKLFSCPQAATEQRFKEGTCAYAIGGVDRLEFDEGAGDFDDTTFAFTLGAQTEFAQDIFVGGALGFESSQTTTQTSSADTTRGRAGLVVKYDDGAFSAGLAVAASYGVVDTTRGLSAGKTDTTSFDARLRLGYGLTFGELAIEPALAVSLLHQRQDGYTETGPALGSRQIAAVDTTTLGVHPSLTLGTDFVAGPFSTRLRPELMLGLDWFSDPDIALTGTGTTGRRLFQSVSPDQLTATLSVGLTVFAADDVTLRLRYGGRFGENTTGHGGEAKVSLGF